MTDKRDVVTQFCAGVLSPAWQSATAARPSIRYVHTDGTVSDISYAELLELLAYTSDFLRAALRRLLPAGRSCHEPCLVAVCLSESPLLPVWELSVLATGAAVVPIDVRDPVDRLASLFADARPQAVVYPASVYYPASPVEKLALVCLRAGLDPCSLAWIAVDNTASPHSPVILHRSPSDSLSSNLQSPSSSAKSSKSTSMASTSSRSPTEQVKSTAARIESELAWRYAFPVAVERERLAVLREQLLDANQDGWAVDPVSGERMEGVARSETVSHVFFTSGSTGQPKGCVVHHGALAAYCWAKNRAHSVDAESVCFVASPHTFDPSMGDYCACLCLSGGATVAMAPRALLFSSLASCLQRSHSTHITTTPSLFETVGCPLRNESDLRRFDRLRVVCLGGEKMSPALARRWASHVHLYNVYGVTECMGYQTSCRVVDPDRCADLGQVLAPDSCRVFVVPLRDAAAAAPSRWYELGGGQPSTVKRGEIWLAGQQVGRGYLGARLAAASAKAFPRHDVWGRCYRTGDLAAVRPDGSLSLVGRKDWQVKIRGVRTELGEIDACLNAAFAPTLIAAAVAVPVAGDRPRIAAAVVVVADTNSAAVVLPDKAPGARLLRDVLRHECHRLAMPLHLIPSQFVCVAGQLPVTATGKLDRAATLALVAEHAVSTPAADEEHSTAAPLSPTETIVARLWSAELGLPLRLIGAASHFAALGGDSLAALRVCLRLVAELGVDSGSDTTEHGFGQLLGPLAPAHLLRLQLLGDYARHLDEQAVASAARPAPPTAASAEQPDDDDDSSELARARQLLYRAVAEGQTAVVDYLLCAYGEQALASGAESKQQRSPLQLAVFGGHADIVRLLLARTAPALAARDPHGAGLLHAAAHAPNEHAFGLVAAALAEAQVARHAHPLFFVDDDRQSVLHHAARFGAPLGVVRQIVLLEQQLHAAKSAKSKARVGPHKPMIVWTDRWLRTPLHWASVNGHAALIGELLRLCPADVDLAAKDVDGETALDIAERRARCGAQDRQGERASKWGAVAKVLGGSGTTQSIRSRLKAKD